MKQLGLAAGFLALAGCASLAPVPLQITSTYDANETAWARQIGAGSIEGSAVLRTNGGDVRHCGGLKANLIPASVYANERLLAMYKNLDRGYVDTWWGYSNTMPEADSRYRSDIREVPCDPQGKFKFSNLAPGTYYVTVPVTWTVGSSPQGGILMQKVELSADETLTVTLTQ